MMNKRRYVEKLHRNNKGFSLVEVLIAMSILAIISLMAMRFMMTSSNTYSRSSSDVDLQSEAQLVANSLKELIIDCQVSTKFFPGEVGFSDGVNNYPNALLINNEDEQILVFQEALSTGGYEDELKYVSRKRNGVTGDFDIPFPAPVDAEILGQYISNFEVNTDSYAKNNTIEFSISYKLRDREYTGNYQVYMRNKIVIDENTNYEKSDMQEVTQVIVSPPLVTITPRTTTEQFAAVVRTNGWLSTDKTWALNVPESEAGCILADGYLTLFGEPAVDTFKVIATSVADTSKAGSATVRVKKVTDMTMQAVSGIVGQVEGVQAAAMNSKVHFMTTVNGWNLTGSDQSVIWKLEYKPNYSSGGDYTTITEFNTNTASYENRRPEIGQISSGGLLTLGKNATTNYEFRITATSTFPNYPGSDKEYESAETLLRIMDRDIEFDGKFIRDLDINLLDYFLSGQARVDGVVNEEVTEIKHFSGVSNPNGAEITVNTDELKEGILHVDEDSFHYQNQEAYKNYYYSQTLQVSYVDQNDATQIMNVTLPDVYLAKGEPEENYIIAAKGTTTDIKFKFGGMNITGADQIGIYVDGEKVSSNGSSSVNRYISSYLQTVDSNGGSVFGTKTKYIDSLTARMMINSTDSHYPTQAIPYRITIDDFYQKTSGMDNKAYIDYDVYVANVQGQKIYVPGPQDTEKFPTGIGTNERNYTVEPMDITVKMYRQNNKYYMVYNNKTYTYDEVYSYWKQR